MIKSQNSNKIWLARSNRKATEGFDRMAGRIAWTQPFAGKGIKAMHTNQSNPVMTRPELSLYQGVKQ